jgi:hypothetical protein
MSNDDALGTALWLVAGGAAGYAAGRWLVAPHLAKPTSATAPTARLASSSSALAGTLPAPKATPTPPPRALASGPSGQMTPIDPYASPSVGSFTATPVGGVAGPYAGPSGEMRPIDPYADAAPNVAVAPVTTNVPIVAVTTTTATSLPTSSGLPTRPPMTIDGPITMPSQLVVTSTPSALASASGPITLPSQLDARPTAHPNEQAGPVAQTPSAAFATSSRVRRFDPVFARYRGSLPIEYVRALVERESNGQPSVRTGSAIGLMQIVPVVLDDYNKRHGTAYRSEHLTDPATNVAIGCELLRLIVESYRKNHPRITTLQADWNNPGFVELLTFGWNAGFSEAGGVGRVMRYLEGLGAVDITIDQVAAHAKLAGASKHLSNPAKVAWCKSVVALYQRERAIAPAFASS